MELNRFKIYLQNYLAEGLMLVVGSGLSCAEGLPGMMQLSEAIDIHVRRSGARLLMSEWEEIRPHIALHGLEGALHKRQPSHDLGLMMVDAIASAVQEKERTIIASVLAGERVLPLTKLLPLMAIGPDGLAILTTNYDRLVELACCRAGIWVDSLFDGDPIGALSADRWKLSQVDSWQRDKAGGRHRPRYRSFARILKPHGSLDWWHSNEGPIRYAGELPGGRAIVTPGLLKYREGYNEPYNTHRNVANDRLASSGRLLFVGYGFNDDHLEATSLMPHLKAGKEALIITLQLSDNARAVLSSLPKVAAIEALDPHARSGTRIHFQGESETLQDESWWDLEKLIEGVLAP